MAEVFGIAGGAIGAISLSIQLAESLQKIKGFYAAVKNAPTQVEELIEEIEIMQDILGDLESESQSAHMASSVSMRRCIKVAQRATKSFVAFSVQLQTRMKKSKFRGGVKFALSRGDIKEMLDQLERTKSSLSLAYSLYQQATAEDRHTALTSVVSSSLDVAQGAVQNTGTITRSTSQVSRCSRLSGERLFHMTTPEWISNTIWQLEMRRSMAGSWILLRTYGIVPWDAPVVEACYKGDVAEMQRLFDNRLASPFDRSPDWSLWEIAGASSQGDSLRLLSQYDGASDLTLGSERGALDALDVFHYNGHLNPRKEPLLGVGRRFREEMMWLRDLADDADGDEWPSPLFPATMRLLLCPPEDADSIWFWQFIENAITGLSTVPEGYIVKDMLNRYMPEHHGDKTPLQLVAVATACQLRMLHLSQDQSSQTRCLEVIIAAIIATGAGLHESDHHHTPLLLFLSTIPGYRHWFNEPPTRPKDLRRGLIVWLKILQRVGVDLVAYGAQESRHFLAYGLLESPVPPLLHWHNMHPVVFSDEIFYFTFSYGPEPEDWTVELDHMADQYVGDFWQMPGLLDENVRAVPGAWTDDSSFM